MMLVFKFVWLYNLFLNSKQYEVAIINPSRVNFGMLSEFCLGLVTVDFLTWKQWILLWMFSLFQFENIY